MEKLIENTLKEWAQLNPQEQVIAFDAIKSGLLEIRENSLRSLRQDRDMLEENLAELSKGTEHIAFGSGATKASY